MRKIICVFLFIIILLQFEGCSSSNHNNSIAERESIPQTSIEKMTQQEALMTSFEKAFPKAEIVGKSIVDIDNDKEEDLVIIFNNPIGPTETTKSNICVITSSSINALDLAAGDLNFQFANGPDSLRIIGDPTRASIMMRDSKSNRNIDYQVTVTADKKTKLINFKIDTVIK